MNGEAILRRLSGAFRNAVVWGGAWFALGFAIVAAMRLADGVSVAVSLGDALLIATKLGFIGGIAGGAFAGFISLVYRGRRLSDISWLRFGVGGGIVAGLVVPALLQMGNLLSGNGVPLLAHILDDTVLAALFGALAAGGSMKLAQRAEALSSGASPGRLDTGRPEHRESSNRHEVTLPNGRG